MTERLTSTPATHPTHEVLHDGSATDAIGWRSGDPGRDPCQHRRGALDEVRAELAEHPDAAGPAVAVRTYGAGHLAVGLAGPVDPVTADVFALLLREVHHLASRELVLTFGWVSSCDRSLSRVVDRARMAHLLDGGRVELHDVPAMLLVDLDLACGARTPDRR